MASPDSSLGEFQEGGAMELIGLGTGAVALIPQLYGYCSAYLDICCNSSNEIGTQGIHILDALDCERRLLKNWVAAHGLDKGNISGTGFAEDDVLVARILARISLLFEDAESLQAKYGLRLGSNKISTTKKDVRRTKAEKILAFFCLEVWRKKPMKREREDKGKKPLRADTTSTGVVAGFGSPEVANFDLTLPGINEAVVGLRATAARIQRNLNLAQCTQWIVIDREKFGVLVQNLKECNDSLNRLKPVANQTSVQNTKVSYLVSHPMSANFTGRQHELDMLEANFFGQGTQTGRRTAAMYGFGGAGKTQIAVKFVNNNRHRFDYILWVDASSRTAVEASFTEIAKNFKLPENNIDCVRNYLSSITKEQSWLLVIDNADDLPQLCDLIPAADTGNVLLTGRNRELLRSVSTAESSAEVQVGAMKDSDAVELLLKIARLKGDNEAAEGVSIREEAQKIARQLGCHALALVQAGAYIRNSCLISEFLKVFAHASNRHDILADRKNPDSYHNKAVYATFELSLESIIGRNGHLGHMAIDLLQVFGFLHHENILEELFVEASKGLSNDVTPDHTLRKLLNECGQPWNSHRFHRLIEPLQCYSLIEFDLYTRSISVHPLIHQWLRDRQTTESQKEALAESARHLLAAAIVQDSGALSYAFRSRLLPHVNANMTHLPPEVDENLTLDYAFKNFTCKNAEAFAALFYELGRLEDAERLEEAVLEKRKYSSTTYTDATSPIVDSSVRLGRIYRARGKFDESVKLLEELEKNGRVNDTLLVVKLEVAAAYAGKGDFARAEELEREVLDTRVRIFGDEHIETAKAKGNLGMTYWRQGKFAQAEKLFGESFAYRKKVLGPEHPDTLRMMGNLSSAIRGQRRWAEAEELHVQQLNIRKKVLGEEHPDVGRALANLGWGIWRSGEVSRYDVAKAHVERALVIFDKTLGKWHPHVSDALSTLGKLWLGLGEAEEAERVLREALERRMRIYGAGHFATRESMEEVVDALEKLGRKEEAKEMRLRACRKE